MAIAVKHKYRICSNLFFEYVIPYQPDINIKQYVAGDKTDNKISCMLFIAISSPSTFFNEYP